jgi:uncharacterized protein (DUF433 family)
MAEETNDNELHKDFLDNLPEDVDRDVAEQLVPHWDKYVQEKFMTNAEEQKKWEPYSALQVGDNTVDLRTVKPEELAELLTYMNMSEEELTEALGGTTTKPSPEEEEYVDPLEAEVKELRAWREEQTQKEQERITQEQAAQSAAWVNSEIDKIKKDYPDLTDDHVNYICALAARYPVDEEMVQKGFADFQKLVGETEKNFFEKKEAQPKPAVQGGTSNTEPGNIKDFEVATEAAAARIRRAMAGGG